MRWRRGGHIYMPDGTENWAQSHAQVPRCLPMPSGTIRVFYCSRDRKNRSQTAWLEIDPLDPTRIVRHSAGPILSLGATGHFDDSGIIPSDVVWFGEKVYFYYVGWNVGQSARYHTAIGLAISRDGGENFTKISVGPIIERSIFDPVGVSCQSIRCENGRWRTWYMSYLGWEKIDGQFEPRYHLKYAESDDGICWDIQGQVALDILEDEGGLACPAVIHNNDNYHMWFSTRGYREYRRSGSSAYHIEHAVSSDGLKWERTPGIAALYAGEEGWDSHMVAYPSLFQHAGSWTMLYNGNGFGRSGFGFAKLDQANESGPHDS
jgi:hypothetical protein